MLNISKLHVSVQDKTILKNLNLEVKKGEVHAIMGPNGSGKSTLSLALAGKQDYKIESGSITFKNQNINTFSPETRAAEGIFVAFQNPMEIEGISNEFFMWNSINAIRKYHKKTELGMLEFQKILREQSLELKIPNEYLMRDVNLGFSGGEKKRNDILHMSILKPDLCVLDETDSGLDIDALKNIASHINRLRNHRRSFIVITHYQRILEYIKPDYIHILYQGSIVKSGGIELVRKLEDEGYAWL